MLAPVREYMSATIRFDCSLVPTSPAASPGSVLGLCWRGGEASPAGALGEVRPWGGQSALPALPGWWDKALLEHLTEVVGHGED